MIHHLAETEHRETRGQRVKRRPPKEPLSGSDCGIAPPARRIAESELRGALSERRIAEEQRTASTACNPLPPSEAEDGQRCEPTETRAVERSASALGRVLDDAHAR